MPPPNHAYADDEEALFEAPLFPGDTHSDAGIDEEQLFDAPLFPESVVDKQADAHATGSEPVAERDVWDELADPDTYMAVAQGVTQNYGDEIAGAIDPKYGDMLNEAARKHPVAHGIGQAGMGIGASIAAAPVLGALGASSPLWGSAIMRGGQAAVQGGLSAASEYGDSHDMGKAGYSGLVGAAVGYGGQMLGEMGASAVGAARSLFKGAPKAAGEITEAELQALARAEPTNVRMPRPDPTRQTAAWPKPETPTIPAPAGPPPPTSQTLVPDMIIDAPRMPAGYRRGDAMIGEAPTSRPWPPRPPPEPPQLTQGAPVEPPQLTQGAPVEPPQLTQGAAAESIDPLEAELLNDIPALEASPGRPQPIPPRTGETWPPDMGTPRLVQGAGGRFSKPVPMEAESMGPPARARGMDAPPESPFEGPRSQLLREDGPLSDDMLEPFASMSEPPLPMEPAPAGKAPYGVGDPESIPSVASRMRGGAIPRYDAQAPAAPTQQGAAWKAARALTYGVPKYGRTIRAGMDAMHPRIASQTTPGMQAVGRAAGEVAWEVGAPALTDSKVNAQDQIAYGGDPATTNYALSAVLSSGKSGLSAQDEQTMTSALMSGSSEKLRATDWRLRMTNPAYARAIESELRSYQEGED